MNGFNVKFKTVEKRSFVFMCVYVFGCYIWKELGHDHIILCVLEFFGISLKISRFLPENIAKVYRKNERR